MNYLESVKLAAFKDELEKIALKNQVATGAIRGGIIGATAVTPATAYAMSRVLDHYKVKGAKTGLIIAAATAGALAGARIGGGMGAFIGGGEKGTHSLEVKTIL